MAHKLLAVGLGIIVATTPVSAANPEPTPTPTAPNPSEDAKYCLRVEPFTGTLIQSIWCRTRKEWAEQGVDVDKEWAKEGVRIIG